MKRLYGTIFCMCLIISLVLSGCFALDASPSVGSVGQRLRENYSDIQTVVDFMVNSGYEDIYIDDTSGEMLADLMHIEISNAEVKDAVKLLLGSGTYKSFSKLGNTISILQWRGTVRDIGCGIAYSVNSADAPEIAYMTQLEPLSVDGWYYYFSDYNSWRAENSSAKS